MARPKTLPVDHYRLSTYKRGSNCYVYGYRNVWDPVRRQSRSVKRFYVGVLNEARRQVRLCQRFLANHPEYEGKVLYYESHELIEKRLVAAKCRRGYFYRLVKVLRYRQFPQISRKPPT